MAETEAENAESWFDAWCAAMPERKLELIDGRLVINTLVGSRRVLRELIVDYGPDLFLPMAAEDLWWSALREAYDPRPRPRNAAEWSDWADAFVYEPDVASAGPFDTDEHHRLYELLHWGLWHFGRFSRAGHQLGRDFVIRLGENGLTPDVIFVERNRLENLRSRYLDGPPSIAVEIVQAASEEQDLIVKKRLYEEACIPEYWVFESEKMRVSFHQLQADGRYQPVVIGKPELERVVETREDVVYDSVPVPGLSLSMLKLWTMGRSDIDAPLAPFVPVELALDAPNLGLGEGGIEWDSTPFAPRVATGPVPIRFDEFISWCGRAKFESWGEGLKIDGTEGTRRVAGMLLMTFGLTETVRLGHPREWVTFLDRGKFRAAVRRHATPLLGQAVYETCEGFRDEVYQRGEIPGVRELDGLWGYGDTLEECREDLTKLIEGRVLLKIARREEIPRAGGQGPTQG